MPPEAHIEPLPRQGIIASLPEAWRRPLTRLALAWAAILLLTAHDWFEMAGQWWNSSTYNHILLIPAIIGWLVWMRRRELAPLGPQGWWPGLVATALALFGWLAGSIAGVNLVSQAGAVAALVGAVLALLGPRVGAGLAFPLAYSAFLVPFGDEFVPPLQMITARIVVALVGWSGVPAQIDGVFIDTPGGLFEVAEACSGVQFLVAMIALGALVANCCFRSWARRIAFMAVAIVLPVVANGVRAWGTIFIAQSQGIEFAAGFDHIFYGWIFFALVIAMLLGMWWRSFDRAPEDPAFDPAAIEASPLLARLADLRLPGNAALAALCALVLGFAVWSTLAARVEAPLPERVALPQVSGWTMVDAPQQLFWEPRATGADHRLFARYRDGQGQTVDVFLALYSAQREGQEATAFGEGALMLETPWRWLEPGASDEQAQGDWLFALGSIKRLAQTSYRRGDLTTGSASRFKLATMRDKLLLRSQPAMMLIVSSEDRDASRSVAAFAAAIGDRGAWMDHAAGLR
ncbi:MAG: exosortase A [Sphingomonadales bacterium]|nr:exosortase A [Sphingomonadales bacterium]MBD3772277.1 exosortase A [Paracoccaceae bacterium]